MIRDLVASLFVALIYRMLGQTPALSRDCFRGCTDPSGWMNNGGRALTVLACRLFRGSDAFPGISQPAVKEAPTPSVIPSPQARGKPEKKHDAQYGCVCMECVDFSRRKARVKPSHIHTSITSSFLRSSSISSSGWLVVWSTTRRMWPFRSRLMLTSIQPWSGLQWKRVIHVVSRARRQLRQSVCISRLLQM